MKNLTRRNFIGQASCAALGTSSMLNTLVNLKALNAAAVGSSSVIGGGDYKALVCFFLSGGNDSFNMLVPRDASSYQEYATTRSNQSLNRGDLLTINPRTPMGGKDFGLHPAMTRTAQLFNDQKLSFISNIGTLIEPTSTPSVMNGTARLPLGLFSHSDQIQQWQTATPHQRSSLGWGGKVADLIKDVNSNPNMSMNLSLSGTNIFQTGRSTVEYSLDRREGSIGIYGHSDDHPTWNVFDSMRTRGLDNIIDKFYDDAFKAAYVSPIKSARDNHIEFQEALGTLSPFNTMFEYDNYGIVQNFEMVAKSIAMRDLLGFKRQIFFVDMGGWDHHDELLGSQQDMLYIVDQALGSFNDVLEEMGVSDCVTTFGISEFGRTLTSNGNGTDHAWGGNVFVMGGDVNGGEIYGDYPSLALGAPQEFYSALVPTTSADEYFAELAMWFGVNDQELGTIFPNLGNFYNIGSGNAPIGFLNV